jgi:hypothetical protein
MENQPENYDAWRELGIAARELKNYDTAMHGYIQCILHIIRTNYSDYSELDDKDIRLGLQDVLNLKFGETIVIEKYGVRR